MKHAILFVHGFGVMKDARGMFTDIIHGLPEDFDCVLTDLNTKKGSTIYLNPFSKQVEVLVDAWHRHPAEHIDLICHSQGCVIAALANLPNIRKTIFLAPDLESSNEKTIEYFSRNPATKIDIDGVSVLARRDGTFTLVPSDYWKEKENINLSSLYAEYIKTHDTYVIKASQDEVVTDTNDTVFDLSKVIEIEADHDFRHEAREKLVHVVNKLLQ